MGETKGGERLALGLNIDALLDFLNGGLVQDLLKAGGYDQAEAERRRLVRQLKAAKLQQEGSAGEGTSTSDEVTRGGTDFMLWRKLVLFVYDMYLIDAVKESGRAHLEEGRQELIKLCAKKADEMHRPRTNWERVHNMTMEELADFISKLGGHTCTPSGPKCPTGECRKCWERWFKEEINEQPRKA